MANEKFTPGPWNNNLHDGQVFCSGGMLVGSFYTSMRTPEQIKANAKLAAAAPAMYEALKMLYGMVHIKDIDLTEYERGKIEAALQAANPETINTNPKILK